MAFVLPSSGDAFGSVGGGTRCAFGSIENAEMSCYGINTISGELSEPIF